MTQFNRRFSRNNESILESFLLYAQKYARERSKTSGTSGINTKRYYRELNTFIQENFRVVEQVFLEEVKKHGRQERNIFLRKGDLAYITYKTKNPYTEIYDEQAVSLILRNSKKTSTVYGLNFHYMPPSERSEAIRLLINKRINFPIRTLHSYVNRNKIEVYKIPNSLWSSFIMLPIEKFWLQHKIKNKTTWSRITKESVWKWAMNDRRKITGTIQGPRTIKKTSIEKDIQKDIDDKLDRILRRR